MTEKTTSVPSTAQGDDRNLVAVDPANASTFEDRLFLFWKDYRTPVLAVIVVMILGIAGFQMWKGMQRGQERDVRLAFGVATTPEAKRGFVREHPTHPLSGLALLQLADDAFKAGNFADAIRDYSQAGTILTEPALSGRARIGAGIATYKSGDAAGGETVLRTLAEDAAALKPYRAQAYYEMASAAATAGDAVKARELIDKLAALETQDIWRAQAEGLRARLPAQEFPLPSLVPDPALSTPAPAAAP